MTDVYPALKRERSLSPFLEFSLSNPNAHDLSSEGKEQSLIATPLSPFTFPSSTHMFSDIKSDLDHKLDVDASPSQSPTLVADSTTQNFKLSQSPTPSTPARTSKSSTPPGTTQLRTPRKSLPAPVQLIGDLPVARNVALSTFNEIYDNNYQYKSLGRSREVLESMTCDCAYEHGVDSPDCACGPYSDCINRLTQVECLEGDCKCRLYCQNQRFQRKQYANIEIVLTEKKGYGLRAESDLPRDTFIYEYVGDVVNPISFKKRMREYAEEGIRHFYFMMLQKDEFIDATKSGGIGRFANHSCNPNCYVAKWTVGEHVRMGIFAKRNITALEELTFNYNVDRYGHQAQECFCGEPMCVGYIGGKTQTDIVTMDDLYLDALGITDEKDLMELKGTKKKKGKKIDDPDFMPTMKGITEKEVPKVVQAIRQSPSRKVLSKLLTRMKITEDQAALRQIMRLRGYSLMTNVLEDHSTDMELITLSLECMTTWPLLNRNKVQDSKVNTPVESCLLLDNETIRTLAQSLLDHWATLPVYNRIPKRIITEMLGPTDESMSNDRRTKFIDEGYRRKVRVLDFEMYGPTRERQERPPSPNTIARAQARAQAQAQAHLEAQAQAQFQAQIELHKQLMERNRLIMENKKIKADSIKAIIASATETAAAEEALAAAAAADLKAKAAAEAEKAARKKERLSRKALTPEEKGANKEKRLSKLVGAVVVKCMSKYAKSFDRDSFKKYAKELTEVIADKEKKSSSYREGRLDALSDEKAAKIKKFSKEYIAKIVRRLEKSGGKISKSTPCTQDTPSTSIHTFDSNDAEDAVLQEQSMTVEEAMGMDLDSASEDDEDLEDSELNQHYSNTTMLSPSAPPQSDDVQMDVDTAFSASLTTDPRRRPFNA